MPSEATQTLIKMVIEIVSPYAITYTYRFKALLSTSSSCLLILLYKLVVMRIPYT